MSAVYNSTVQGFYLSYYGRPADPAGLTFWTGQLAAAGGNLSAILDAFGTSAEATRRYGTGTNASKIEAIYQQTFGRAADPVGLAFYEGELAAGRMTLINASKRIIDGAAGDDITIRTNRLSAAQSFTDKLDTDAEKAGYSGSGAEDAARAWITTVTKDAATVTAAVATADATITGLLPQTFNLTSSADTFTGAAGNDKFSGAISGLTASATLNATDKLDGGAGTDTITLSQAVNWDGFTSGFLKNVETVELNNTGTASLTFSGTGTSGVTGYSLTGTSGSMTLSNLATGVTSLTVNGMKSSTTTVSVTTSFVSGAAEETGSADALTVNLNNVGNSTISSTSTERHLTLTAGSYETVNLVSPNANVVALTGSTSLKKINASGAGTLNVNAVNAELTDFDASAMTAAVTANLRTTSTTGLKTVKTGSGADAVTVEVGKLTGNATISGGAGADVLTMRSGVAIATAEYAMSGFETMRLADVSVATTLSGSKTTDLTTISSRNTVTDAVTLTGYTGDLTFEALGTVSADGATTATTVDAGDISSDHTGATTLKYIASSKTVSDATSAQAPAADYTFSKSSSVAIDIGAWIDASNSTVDAGKATSVTLTSVSSKNAAATETAKIVSSITAGDATTVSINAASSMDSFTLTAGKAKSVTITNGGTAATTAVNLAIGAATTLNLTSGEAFTVAAGASDLSKVQSLTIAANKLKTTITNDLTAAASVTLSGTSTATGARSEVSLGNVGKAYQSASDLGNQYDLNLTATGLRGGLTIGDLRTGNGYSINADFSGVTGAVSITNPLGLRTSGGAGENTKDITINSKGMGSTGSLSIASAIQGTGTVSIDASGSSQATIGNITAGNITVDVSGTSSLSSVGTTIGLGGTLNLKLHELAATANYAVTANSSATALTLNLTGGVAADNFTVNGISGVSSITLAGDLGAGDDLITVNNNFSTAATITLANLKSYTSASIYAGTASDTITGGAGDDTIWGNQGTNNLTGGGGADVFAFNVGDSNYLAVNTINDFTKSQADKISYGGGAVTTMAALTATTIGSTSLVIDARGVATITGTATAFDTLIEIAQILSNAANTSNSGIGKAAFFRLAGDTAASYLFIESGGAAGNGDNDTIIRLVGVGLPTSDDTIGTGGTGISGFGA